MKLTKNVISRTFETFSKESLLSGFLFFLVLSSWYILRPVRNEMAVQNASDLPLLLAAGAFAMLLVNPIYSWVASRSNLKKIIISCYSFLILNLLAFLYSWRVLDMGDSILLGQIFYIWCNVYSFFVVSIFWVLIINIFRNSKSRSFYGVIAAGGSMGAFFGSEISKRFAYTFEEFGLEFFSFSAAILLFLAMLVAIFIINNLSSEKDAHQSDEIGGGSLDAIKNVIKTSEIRSIALYTWIWTALMTVHWVTAITIIDDWSQDPQERIIFFSLIEQVVTPLTLITQLFLTNNIIKYWGIKNILISYGFLFLLAFISYGLMPSITVVAIATVALRLFEYGINKPTRETIYSFLNKNDRYKSSVFIDTFITRFGDLTGVSFIALGKMASVGFSVMPVLAIPFAAVLSYTGFRISKNSSLKDL
jgi:AAA family ATP:ADP antiporter